VNETRVLKVNIYEFCPHVVPKCR